MFWVSGKIDPSFPVTPPSRPPLGGSFWVGLGFRGGEWASVFLPPLFFFSFPVFPTYPACGGLLLLLLLPLLASAVLYAVCCMVCVVCAVL